MIDSALIFQHRDQEILKNLFPKKITKSDFELIILPWMLEGKMPDAAWNRLNNAVSTPRSLSGRLFSSSSSSSNKKATTVISFTDQVKASIKTALSLKELSQQDEAAIENSCTEQALRLLPCPTLKHTHLIKLSGFLSSLSPVEKEQPKVACFIQWLKKKFDPEKAKHINKFNNFFVVYEVAKKITQYGFAMKGDNDGALLKKLNAIIEKYFAKGFKVPEILPAEIEKFDNAYDILSESKKTNWVKDFFKDWFSNALENDNDDDNVETSHQTRAELFCELCNTDYQACIRISDQDLKEGYQQYTAAINEKDAPAENNIYFSNLCLLYALSFPVSEWSVAFHDTLKKISKKPNVCPSQLLPQINYLLECYLGESVENKTRPELAVLTPALIKTPDDVHVAFSYIASAVNRGQCSAQFIRDAIETIKTKIKNINGSNLAEWLSQFKKDSYRQLVVQELLDNLEGFDLQQTIKIVSLFQQDSARFKVLKTLINKLPSLLYEDINNLFSLFKDDTQHPRVLKLIKHKLPNIPEETVKIFSVFKGDPRRLRVLKTLVDKLPILTCEATIKFVALFESEEHRLKALNIIKTKLPIFVTKEVELILAQFKTDAKRQEASALISNLSNQNNRKETKFGDNLVEFCSWLQSWAEKAEIKGVKFLQELCIECKENLSSSAANQTFFRSDDKENYRVAMEKLIAFVEMSESISTQDATSYLSRLLEANGKKISDIGRMLKTASEAVLTRYNVKLDDNAVSASLSESDEDENEASTSSSSYRSN